MELVGLWHGLSILFMIWGAIHAIYMSFESVLTKVYPEMYKGKSIWISSINAFRTFVLVSFAWIFFRAQTLPDAIYITRNLLNFSDFDLFAPYNNMAINPFSMFIVNIISIIILIIFDWSDKRLHQILENMPIALRWGIYYIGIFLIYIGMTGTTEGFIYFQF